MCVKRKSRFEFKARFWIAQAFSGAFGVAQAELGELAAEVVEDIDSRDESGEMGGFTHDRD